MFKKHTAESWKDAESEHKEKEAVAEKERGVIKRAQALIEELQKSDPDVGERIKIEFRGGTEYSGDSLLTDATIVAERAKWKLEALRKKGRSEAEGLNEKYDALLSSLHDLSSADDLKTVRDFEEKKLGMRQNDEGGEEDLKKAA